MIILDALYVQNMHIYVISFFVFCVMAGHAKQCSCVSYVFMGRNSLDAYCAKNWSYFDLVRVTFVTSSELFP